MPSMTSLGKGLLTLRCPSVVLVAVVFASGCDGSRSEPSESLPAVAPLDSLAAIRLPTTVRELSKARPTAMLSSFGLHETIGGIDVRYFADRDAGSEAYPTSKARVSAIEAVWGRINDDSAATMWQLSRERLTEVLRGPPGCFRLPSSPTLFAVAFARWQTPSGSIAHLRLQHSFTGPIMQPAAFTIGFSLDTAILDPVLSGAARTSCEDPFRLDR